jgi:tRNA(adenine34) deaminase
VIAASRNQIEKTKDISMHAEIDCIRKAASVLQTWRLSDCTLYTTLEPCPMCMGAILNSRIKTVVYAAGDSRVGSCGSMLNINDAFPFHRVEIVRNILGEESSTLLKRFFQTRRAENEASDVGFSDRGDEIR